MWLAQFTQEISAFQAPTFHLCPQPLLLCWFLNQNVEFASVTFHLFEIKRNKHPLFYKLLVFCCHVMSCLSLSFSEIKFCTGNHYVAMQTLNLDPLTSISGELGITNVRSGPLLVCPCSCFLTMSPLISHLHFSSWRSAFCCHHCCDPLVLSQGTLPSWSVLPLDRRHSILPQSFRNTGILTNDSWRLSHKPSRKYMVHWYTSDRSGLRGRRGAQG